MRKYANSTVSHLVTRKRLTFFVLFLVVCGGAVGTAVA